MTKPMIPVKRFAQIVDEAERAYKCEDWLTIAQLNEELSIIKTGLFWQDGKSYLLILNVDEPLPFDDIIQENEDG